MSNAGTCRSWIGELFLGKKGLLGAAGAKGLPAETDSCLRRERVFAQPSPSRLNEYLLITNCEHLTPTSKSNINSTSTRHNVKQAKLDGSGRKPFIGSASSCEEAQIRVHEGLSSAISNSLGWLDGWMDGCQLFGQHSWRVHEMNMANYIGMGGETAETGLPEEDFRLSKWHTPLS